MTNLKEEIVTLFAKSLDTFRDKRFSYGSVGPKEKGQIIELYLPRQVGKSTAMLEIASDLGFMGVDTVLVTQKPLKYSVGSVGRYCASEADNETDRSNMITSIAGNSHKLGEALQRKKAGFRVILIDEVPLKRIEEVVNGSLDYDTFVFLVSTDY